MNTRLFAFPFLGAALSCMLAASPACAGGSDLEYKIWFEPKSPVIGATYKMFIQVWNNDDRFAQRIRAVIYRLPEKDRLISASTQQQRVGPRGTYTFVFEILCGSPNGNITWDLVPDWAD